MSAHAYDSVQINGIPDPRQGGMQDPRLVNATVFQKTTAEQGIAPQDVRPALLQRLRASLNQ